MEVNTLSVLNEESKKNNFSVILLIIILSIFVLSTGFLIYQNQKLTKNLQTVKNDLALIQNQDKPIIDPKANWRIYTNQELGFTLKYPETYQELISVEILNTWPNAVVVLRNTTTSIDLPVEVWSTETEYKEKYLGNDDITVLKNLDGKIITLANINHDPTIEEIASTLQIISTKQLACTEDAMICPDGSAVGRNLPDCEFDPCPN